MNHLDACQQDLLQTGTRKLRPLLLSVLCLVACHVVAGEEAVLAQRRVPANSQVETPSQRVLPLPEGGSTDLRQQVEWLRQLKGLLGAGGELPNLPPLDAEQMKLVREAMKQFGGGRPDGTQPPAFDGNSLEQVSKALADPAMREQVRKALEQLQPDGQLPRDAAAADPQGSPFPSRSPGQGQTGARSRTESGRSSTGAAEDSSAMPQALQDLLKRLTPPTDRSPNGTSPEREPMGDAANESPTDAPARNAASPDGSPLTPGGSSANGRAAVNGPRPSGEARPSMERSTSESSNLGRSNASRQNSGPSNADRSNPVTRPEARSQTPSTEPNLPDDRRPSQREPKPTELQISPNREPSVPESGQPSPARSPRGMTQPPGVTPPSGLSPRGNLGDTNSPRPAVGRTPDPRPATNDDASDMAPNGTAPRGATQNGSASSGTRRTGTAADDAMNRDSMNRDSTGRRFPSSDSAPPDERVASRERSPRSSTMPLNPEPTPLETRSGSSRPSMDVRSELEQQGFAKTLQKLVEQARTESLAAPNGAKGASGSSMPVINGSRPGPDSPAGASGSSAAPQGSLSRIMDSLGKGLNDAATESRSNLAVPTGRTDSVRTTPSISSAGERPSTLNNVTKATNNFLSDLTTAPAPRPSPMRSSNSVTSGAKAVPQGADSRSMWGLLMLLAVLGLVWYFTPQLMTALSESQRKASVVCDVIHPADIRSRVDVVRAFHQFALRPATLAAEWWTHRAVEQQIAQDTPALQPAIQTLTDLYEQARYLPDDADFGPDQIGTARQALEQCEASSPIVG